jgi:lysophospholipase L1-like esterase
MFRISILSLALFSLLICCKKPVQSAIVNPPQDSLPVDSIPVNDTSGNNPVTRTYLALGDSYTIGQSVAVSERFPVQLTTLLNAGSNKFLQPEIIAQTGWTTSNLLTKIETTAPLLPTYDIVTLLIGVNNQYQHRSQDEYRQQFTTLLNKSIQYAGNNKKRVFVLSIPDYSVTPFANGSNRELIASQIDSFNVINKSIALQYEVNYLDITGFTRMAATDPSLIAGDGLHPSGIEYGIWARQLLPVVQSVLR